MELGPRIIGSKCRARCAGPLRSPAGRPQGLRQRCGENRQIGRGPCGEAKLHRKQSSKAAQDFHHEFGFRLKRCPNSPECGSEMRLVLQIDSDLPPISDQSTEGDLEGYGEEAR